MQVGGVCRKVAEAEDVCLGVACVFRCLCEGRGAPFYYGSWGGGRPPFEHEEVFPLSLPEAAGEHCADNQSQASLMSSPAARVL